jgi:hypothetical protein
MDMKLTVIFSFACPVQVVASVYRYLKLTVSQPLLIQIHSFPHLSEFKILTVLSQESNCSLQELLAKTQCFKIHVICDLRLACVAT